jgi:hypothetical protein
MKKQKDFRVYILIGLQLQLQYNYKKFKPFLSFYLREEIEAARLLAGDLTASAAET